MRRAEPVGVGVDGREHQLALVVVELVPPVEQRLHEALDARQRGAQLVGDGGDQVGALAVEPRPAAPAAQADRDPTTGPRGCLADQARRGEHLVAAALSHAARARRAGRDGVEGPVDVEPGPAVLVLQPQHVLERQPHGVLDVDPEQRGALGVEDGDHALRLAPRMPSG